MPQQIREIETPLPAYSLFDPHSDATSLARRWTKWHARFDNFLLAANIKDAACIRAMLLHYTGKAVYDVFLTLPDRGSDYDTEVAHLKAHFAPKKNISERRVLSSTRSG